MNPPAHLHPEAAALLTATVAERIHFVQQDTWVGYPRAEEVLDHLEDLLTHPEIGRTPNALLFGHTNNGKSHLIRHFKALNPAHDNPDGESIRVPVLVVESPPKPDIGWLYEKILDSLFIPRARFARVYARERQVHTVLKHIQVGMLVLDELHHGLVGTKSALSSYLNAIKSLGNELHIPIVGVGTLDADQVLRADAQLDNRFERLPLPLWALDEPFQRLILSFERLLPFPEPSSLSEPRMATWLYDQTEGLIGELSLLLRRGAADALKAGEPRLTRKSLQKVRWTRPSDRRRVSLEGSAK